jgi:predicted RNA-binding protein YlxR (DUF448 family)
MTVRYIPERTCVTCGSKQPKLSLIRLVCNSSGSVQVDLIGKMNGRGAYLCRNQNCWLIGTSKGLISKKLRSSISFDDANMLIEFSKTI